VEVRAAVETDLQAIVELTNHEIEHGVAHFGLEPWSPEQARAQFRARRHPWVVAYEEDFLGFAKAGPWKARGAYDRTVEVGVYVRPSERGRGVSTALYRLLIEELRKARVHTVLAGIALPNVASVRLHERFGFRHSGTLPEVGFKFGQFHDVGYWALQL